MAKSVKIEGTEQVIRLPPGQRIEVAGITIRLAKDRQMRITAPVGCRIVLADDDTQCVSSQASTPGPQ